MSDDEPNDCGDGGNADYAVCSRCGRGASEVDLTYAPDPAALELAGDRRCIWLCRDCRADSGMSI